MGEVFRAHDAVLDRHVALKIINADDEDRRQRFRREAQSAARLTHLNIVVVHDFGEASGRFFMAMELLDGFDLKSAIASNALTTVAAKLDVMEQVCDAIAYAHSMGVVHRDLKPANIFVMPHGQVKILDFGLARIGQSDMTGTGTILGTPHYMSPEQIRGVRVDSRADIFSLGSVFYELLSYRKAFHGDSVHSILYKVLQHEPESLRTVSPSVPPTVADMIRKAMTKDPAMRPQTLAEMRDVVRTARGREVIEPITLIRTDSKTEFRSDTLLVRKEGSQVSVVRSGSDKSLPNVPVPVTFSGEIGGDKVVAVGPAQSLLAASLAAGIPHTNECGGNARCSTCRVLVLDNVGNLSPRDSAEIKLAKRLGFSDDIRLACQTKARGPVRVRRLILDRDDINLSRVERNTIVGSELPLAMLYANVREFAPFLKRSLPYDAVHVLNRYYAQIGETVLANGGHIDRYDGGGGLLALFGIKGEDAKTKCTNAIRAALRMSKRMEPLNAYLNEHFGVTFRFEAGLHYGRMTVGHIGHPDHQRLTALGEASNVAMGVARVTAEHDATIFATEELANVIESGVNTGAVVSERLPGLEREYTLYEIVDFAKPDTHYLVQSSFEKVAAQKEEAARLFYEKLFAIAPQVKPMFANVDINVQGAMLMNMLGAAVKGLDRLDELKPIVEDLGRRHFAYGVRIEHFAPVEECLLSVVKTFMGDDFNLDVQLAWTRIYNFVAQTMIEAAVGDTPSS